MRDTIIFDLGGVLIQWDPRHLYRELFEDPDEMEFFLANVCTPAWNATLDAGRPFAEGVAALQKEWPQYHEEIAAYHERWVEMVPGALPGTVAVLRDLQAQDVPLYALTNWSAETLPLVWDRFPFLDEFLGMVVSGEEGLIKPHPEIYHVLLDRYDLDPARTVFIDDSRPNVETARALGLHGIHFTDAPALRHELKACGFAATLQRRHP